MSHYSVYIFHILFVGPLLILLGLSQNGYFKMPEIIWKIVVILGCGIIAYHSFLTYSFFSKNYALRAFLNSFRE